MKNADQFLLEIIAKEVSKNEARELYNSLTKPDVGTLMKSTSRGKNKRVKILNVLNNLESSVFDGVYLHYSDKPSESEESIAERTNLRKQRFDEIAEKEKMISSELLEKYFGYSSPSNIYKALNETIILEENKAQVNRIKRLANLMRYSKEVPQMIQKKI